MKVNLVCSRLSGIKFKVVFTYFFCLMKLNTSLLLLWIAFFLVGCNQKTSPITDTNIIENSPSFSWSTTVATETVQKDITKDDLFLLWEQERTNTDILNDALSQFRQQTFWRPTTFDFNGYVTLKPEANDEELMYLKNMILWSWWNTYDWVQRNEMEYSEPLFFYFADRKFTQWFTVDWISWVLFAFPYTNISIERTDEQFTIPYLGTLSRSQEFLMSIREQWCASTIPWLTFLDQSYCKETIKDSIKIIYWSSIIPSYWSKSTDVDSLVLVFTDDHMIILTIPIPSDTHKDAREKAELLATALSFIQ